MERTTPEEWQAPDGDLPSLIEAELLRDPAVSDCAVLLRANEAGVAEPVAYLVATGLIAPDRLRERLIEGLPGIAPPTAFVQLPSLPLTQGGAVDTEALALLDVADADLLARWEARARVIPGVTHVAAILDEAPGDPPLVHLSDLIHGWKAGPSADGGLVASSRPTAPRPERPMAYADGGPLTIPEGEPRTFTEALFRTAKLHPDKGITYVGEGAASGVHTYAALLDDARRVLTGLRESGLRPGDRVILQQRALKDHFTTFWACVLGGIIPVTVAIAPSYEVAGGVTGKLYNTWELLEHPVILTNKSLVGSISGLAKLYPMEGVKVVATDDFKARPAAETVHAATPDDLIFFQLSSGSTGIPKCIQEKHGSIVRHVHAGAQFNGYTTDDVSLNWLPVDHVVPILTWHLRDVYLGINQVEMKPDYILEEPLRWLDLIEKHQVTQTWAPNFGFKLITDALASAPNRAWDLSSMRFFMNAGEQVTLSVVRDFLAMLRPFGVRTEAMQPAFGMAEVCTCMTYANDFSIEKGVHRVLKTSLGGDLELTTAEDLATVTTFVDLGPPVRGVEIRITDGQNRPVREGVIGRFQIRGGVVTPGYLNNVQANEDAFVGDDWFNSGDLGFILDGRLTLTGREKEIIIVRGANFYCYEIEDVVNTVPGVEPTFSAAAAVDDPATGSEGLAVFFVPKDFSIEERFDVAQAVRTEVTARLGITPSFVVPMLRKDFPKTTSGKIQRVALKKSLVAGRFDDVLKAMDLHQGNANTLPDWFFRRTWRRKEPSHLVAAVPRGRTVIVADRHGLGARLADELTALGASVVLVEAGDALTRLSATHYRVSPRDGASTRELLSLVKEDGAIARVLHLATFDRLDDTGSRAEAFEHAQVQGADSLLFLVQALAFVHDGESPVELLVVSTHAQKTAADDALALEKTPLLGLLRTLPQELGWLRARHLDLATLDVSEGAEAVLRELRAPLPEPEVAYRRGARWVPCLTRADLCAKAAHATPILQGGLYVLAGAIAGTGAEIGRQVLALGARLLVLEESTLPERSTWETHVGQGDALARRIEAHLALENAGGEVLRETVSLTDRAALAAVASRAEGRVGRPIDGVIQLPDEIAQSLLVEETPAGLGAALTVSAHRALALSSLVAGREGALYVCFSSASGIFGSATMGALNAAASFFDAFAHHLRDVGPVRALCLGWTLWDGWDASRSDHIRELARAQGYQAIRASEGWSSLLAALQRDETSLYVGLDGENRRIRGHIEGESRPVQAIRAYYTGPDRRAPLGALRALTVEDRFRTASRADFVFVETMPLTPTGEIDREALVAGQSRGVPETELHREIAAIWQEVLGLPRVGIHDSFFELGGHSLLATQIVSRLRRVFGVDISLSHLFGGPTIAELSKTIEAQQLEQASEAELAGLLSELEGLSESEVSAELHGGRGA